MVISITGRSNTIVASSETITVVPLVAVSTVGEEVTIVVVAEGGGTDGSGSVRVGIAARLIAGVGVCTLV